MYNFSKKYSDNQYYQPSFTEKILENILTDLKYDFISQYGFNDLRGDLGGKLRFDFCIADKSIIPYKPLLLIEYQGAHHYKKYGRAHDYERQHKYNELKKQYCEKHNYPLIEIIYKDIIGITYNEAKHRINDMIKHALHQDNWFGER